ncbi:MAG: spermine synthase [Akkermansiaceae bacterium]|nr:spermine synthase [Akkermansiaceae bacterium]NNM28289.1 spermine synthase [Akkermansiaceae bacterium]
MKPYVQLAEARTPDGTVFSLHEHDGEFYLKNDGHDLMSTALTYSEQMLSDIGCNLVKDRKHPRVLIGGLGLGYSLKRVLEIVGRPATVQVAEVVPEVIDWNRTFLAAHNGPLLDDERTTLYVGDVHECIKRAGKGAYDAILLDVDDTPGSLVLPQNNRLYGRDGLRMIHNALTPGGRVAFWLAEPTPRFLGYLAKAGFRTSEFPAKIHEKAKRARHRIYLGEKIPGGPGASSGQGTRRAR